MKNSNIIAVLPGLVLASLLLLTGCTGSNVPAHTEDVRNHAEDTPEEHDHEASHSEETVSISPAQFRAANIKLGNIQKRPMSAQLKVNGKVNVPPNSRISVSFPYGGFVKTILVKEGEFVSRGSVLAVLENPDFIDLQEHYLKDRNALDYAGGEYQRQKQLYHADVASGKAFEKASSEYGALKASVKASAQKLKMMGIDPKGLTADKIQSTITVFAPEDGYVTRVEVNRGKFINPQEPLIQMNNTENVHIDLTVYEKDIHAIKVGQEVHFSLLGEAGYPHRARVSSFGREIKDDRSVIAHCVPLDKSNNLMPGAFVQGRLLLDSQTVSTLPEAAVVHTEGKAWIFVMEALKDDSAYHFDMLPVITGVTQNGLVQITLPDRISLPDSSVVTTGAFTLLSVLKNEGGHHHH